MKSSAWKEGVGEDLHGERLAVPFETAPRELRHVPFAAVEPAGGHGGTGQEEHGGQCPEGMEHPLHARIIAHPTPRTVQTPRSVNPFNPWTGTRGRSGRVDKWASGRVCELE